MSATRETFAEFTNAFGGQEHVQRYIEGDIDRYCTTSGDANLGDSLAFLNEGVGAIVKDEFSRCFEGEPRRPWNFTFYLFVLYWCGVVVRYLVLFPLRVLSIIIGVSMFGVAMVLVKTLPLQPQARVAMESMLLRFFAGVFVFSWTGVIKYHGSRPPRRPNQIYVANHTSMIDLIVLMQEHTYATVGQKHLGWVGFLQDRVLESMGSIWFERDQSKDRLGVARRIKEHIADVTKFPLLLFPEGTCVNNVYCMMFKKGAFDLGMDTEICPVAIKYNKIFVDAFWNSREQTFTQYLVRLMTSWAVVCDIHFLEPMRREPTESAVDFAQRVKLAICKRIGLEAVPWDGYLKHVKLNPKFVELRRKIFAKRLLSTLGGGGGEGDAATPSDGLRKRNT